MLYEHVKELQRNGNLLVALRNYVSRREVGPDCLVEESGSGAIRSQAEQKKLHRINQSCQLRGILLYFSTADNLLKVIVVNVNQLELAHFVETCSLQVDLLLGGTEKGIICLTPNRYSPI